MGLSVGKNRFKCGFLTRTWTIDDLELELGKRLIEHHPIESQLLVRSERIAKRQSWRLSEYSTIPHQRLNLPISYHEDIHANKNRSEMGPSTCQQYYLRLFFKGRVCSFEPLFRTGEKYEKSDIASFGKEPTVRIALDDNPVLKNNNTQDSLFSAEDSRREELRNR